MLAELRTLVLIETGTDQTMTWIISESVDCVGQSSCKGMSILHYNPLFHFFTINPWRWGEYFRLLRDSLWTLQLDHVVHAPSSEHNCACLKSGQQAAWDSGRVWVEAGVDTWLPLSPTLTYAPLRWHLSGRIKANQKGKGLKKKKATHDPKNNFNTYKKRPKEFYLHFWFHTHQNPASLQHHMDTWFAFPKATPGSCSEIN